MANITYTITQSSEDIAYTVTPDGEEITYIIDDGVGPAGPAGPSNITTATETDITGILKGDGANVGAAVADTDYQSVPAEGAFADGDKTKLDGIEAGADVTDAANVNAAGAVMESDYSPAHSVLAQQSGTGSPSAVSLGTNSLLGRASGAGTSIQGLTAAQARALLNVEDGATADQTDAEILAAVESESGRDMSVDGAKLDGIEAGATADQTAAEILTAIKTVDGTGSGLDADLLDGQDSSAFATSAQGALADSAVQPGDNLDVIGGVTITPPATAGQYLRYDGVSEFRNSAIGASDLPDLSSTYATTSHTHTVEDLDFAGSTDIGADLADADEILVSDGGGNTTRRKSALSRLWTYIKAKIESVALSTLEVTGDLTVDTDTLQVNATTNEVTIAQDLNSQAPLLVVNGFSGFDGGSGVFSVNSGTWNGATITGDQTMSGQIELTGQSASTDDSAMTVGINRQLQHDTIGNLFSLDLGAANLSNSGTSANAILNTLGLGVVSGTSTSGYGKALLASSLGGGQTFINFDRAIKASVCLFFSAASATDTSSGVRFFVGQDAATALDSDALTNKGFGCEIVANGTNHQIRAFAHDGTSYTSGSWVNLSTTNLSLGYYSLVISSDGAGNIAAKISARNGGQNFDTATATGGPNSLASDTNANLMLVAVNKSTGSPSSYIARARECKIQLD